MSKIGVVGFGNVGQAFGKAMVDAGNHQVVYRDIRKLDLDWATPAGYVEMAETCDAIFISVPTESTPDGHCDLSILQGVLDSIGQEIKAANKARSAAGLAKLLVVQKSTVPPGTARAMVRHLATYELMHGIDYWYVSNPSFLNMGTPVADEMAQRKCLIGLRDPNIDGEALKTVYAIYHWAEVSTGTWEETEFAKYANNVMHALILSGWNQMWLMSQKFPGVNMKRVAGWTIRERGLESVYRVMGKGAIGPCIQKDLKAISWAMEECGVHDKFIKSLRDMNEYMVDTYGGETRHWRELMDDAPEAAKRLWEK